MKEKNLFAIILTILVIANTPLIAIKNTSDRIYFLTMPRTGTTWTGFCLQRLTGYNFWNLSRYPFKPNTRSNWDIVYKQIPSSKPPIYHTHTPSALKDINKSQNKLIMTCRNHREVLLRWMVPSRYKMPSLESIGELIDYYNFFEQWPPRNRHLVVYEDLMQKPKETLAGILKFMNQPSDALDSFMENIESYKEQVLAHYKRSVSKGTNMTYHSEHLERSQLQKMDNLIKQQTSASIWDKYFAKYANHYPESTSATPAHQRY